MTELSALVRFVHLVASVLLVGRFAFTCFILRGYSSLALVIQHEKIQARFTTIYVTIALTTHLAALSLQASVVNETSVQGILAFVVSTRYGNVWLGRLILLCLLALPCRLAPGKSAAAFLLSASHLSTLSLSGHAAAAEGTTFALQTGATALHLLATGIWLGGLPPLALVLSRTHRADDDIAFSALQTWVQRFSCCALISVILIIATGNVNAWNLVGGFPQLFGTTYGKLLLSKMVLLLPLLALAAWNLCRLKPSVSAPVTSNGQFVENVLRLRRNALIETALGIAILLIVGHLAVTPPARHVQAEWPFSFRWDWSVVQTSPKAWAEVQRSIVWGVVGLLAIFVAALRRKRRLVTTLLGCGALGYGTQLMHQAVMIDAYPDTFNRPAVAYQAIAIASGMQLYRESGCAVCHGAGGRGDGPAAAELNPKPPDLIGRHANSHTAGDLFWWLSHGVKPTSAMPGFSESLSVEERWDLINYLRALASGDRARNLATIIDEEPKLVAPDFSYATIGGEAKTLKDHRGNRVVLLALLDGEKHHARLQQLLEARDELSTFGVELIVVPRGDKGNTSNLSTWLVSEGRSEIAATYDLFARSFDESAALRENHVEYLIDKQGYLRARWLAAENEGWRNLAALKRQVDLLLKERLRAPAPDDHVH